MRTRRTTAKVFFTASGCLVFFAALLMLDPLTHKGLTGHGLILGVVLFPSMHARRATAKGARDIYIYIYIYIYVYMLYLYIYNMYVYMLYLYIYIYIYREREREMYTYIFVSSKRGSRGNSY